MERAHPSRRRRILTTALFAALGAVGFGVLGQMAGDVGGLVGTLTGFCVGLYLGLRETR